MPHKVKSASFKSSSTQKNDVGARAACGHSQATPGGLSQNQQTILQLQHVAATQGLQTVGGWFRPNGSASPPTGFVDRKRCLAHVNSDSLPFFQRLVICSTIWNCFQAFLNYMRNCRGRCRKCRMRESQGNGPFENAGSPAKMPDNERN